MAAKRIALTAVVFLGLAVGLRAGENLRINPKLNYASDSQDGPLIVGDHMEDGAAAGKPNYIIFYGEG